MRDRSKLSERQRNILRFMETYLEFAWVSADHPRNRRGNGD